METIKLLKEDLFYALDQLQGKRQWLDDNDQVWELIELLLAPDEIKEYDNWVKQNSKLYQPKR